MVARQEADDVLYWKDRNLVLFCVVESHSVIMQWVLMLMASLLKEITEHTTCTCDLLHVVLHIHSRAFGDRHAHFNSHTKMWLLSEC